MIEKVTKQKHPGRVESGKRLAERNRLKRLELKNKEHKEKIITQEEELKEEEEKIIEKPKERSKEFYEFPLVSTNISLLLLMAAGGGLYLGNKIYQKWKTNASGVSSGKTKEIKSEPEKPDPFYME